MSFRPILLSRLHRFAGAPRQTGPADAGAVGGSPAGGAFPTGKTPPAKYVQNLFCLYSLCRCPPAGHGGAPQARPMLSASSSMPP